MKIQLNEVQSNSKGKSCCPLCRLEFEQNNSPDIISCLLCSTKYHQDCTRELSNECAIFGCQGVFDSSLIAEQISTVVQKKEQKHSPLFIAALLIGLPIIISSFTIMPSLRPLSILIYAACGAVIAFNKLRHIRALWKTVSAKEFDPQQHLNSIVSIRGTPNALQALTSPEQEAVLWFQTHTETLRKVVDLPQWMEDNHSRREHCLPFSFGKVTVSNSPDVVHGQQTRKTSLLRQSRWFRKINDQRRLTKLLPMDQEIFVTGRLIKSEDGFLLTRDEQLGLSFSGSFIKTFFYQLWMLSLGLIMLATALYLFTLLF